MNGGWFTQKVAFWTFCCGFHRQLQNIKSNDQTFITCGDQASRSFSWTCACFIPSNVYTYAPQTGPFQPVRLIVYVVGKCQTLQCPIYEHIKNIIMVVKSCEFVPSRRMPCIPTDVRVALTTSVVHSILEIPSTNEIHTEDRNETMVLPGDLAWTKPNCGIYNTQNCKHTYTQTTTFE